MPKDAPSTTVLYRMDLPDHRCPSGLKAKALLEEQGIAFDDRPLTSRADVDAFKAKEGVATTPQVFIDGERIGGYDALAKHFGKADQKTYAPVIAVFAVSAALALATAGLTGAPFVAWGTLGSFIALAMVLLGLQKLQDIQSFATYFASYDLLAARVPVYAKIYPFAETGAGILMFAGVLSWLSAPIALFIAGIGAISVIKAVYIDKRDLNCACVGGNSNVPLGPVSLMENVMMVGMALVMLTML